jgi:ribonuclease P protein subunit RPR2
MVRRGDKGSKGSKGSKGDKGSKGSKGDKGSKGSRGSKGSKGSKGSRGKKIALETIEELFRLAEDTYQSEPELSKKYLELARKISLRVRVKMPKELKMRYCKNCFTPLMAGNCRVRIKKGRVVYTCLNCGNIKRYAL